MATVKSKTLRELIGAAMSELISGEAISHEATLDFIRNVGFTRNKGDTDLGQLRMVSFYYFSSSNNEDAERRTIQVPLLSLVPIPIHQIDEAELDFVIDIEETKENKSKYQLFQNEKNTRIELLGRFGTIDQIEKNKSQIKFKIKIKQSQLPNGYPNLFKILDFNFKEHMQEH